MTTTMTTTTPPHQAAGATLRRALRVRFSDRKVGYVLGAALLTTGLIAGLYYAYAISVMLGLGRTDDRTFVLVMQRINEAIQNAAFMPSFFGALVFPVWAAVLQRRLGLRDATRWTVAAAILYTGALAVTFGFNIPLNEKLADAGDPDLVANLAAVRDDFEGPWVAWNIVRTVLSTAALGCLGRAAVLYGRSTTASREYA